MLKKEISLDGRIVLRLPFRKSLKRDEWEQSPEAKKVSQGWKNIRKTGGTISFTESSEEE